MCAGEGLKTILAVNGDEGYPYAIPIYYFYDKEAGKIISGNINFGKYFFCIILSGFHLLPVQEAIGII